MTTNDALTAIPLFFSSSSQIIKLAKQNDINTDELEKVKQSIGTLNFFIVLSTFHKMVLA